MEQRDGILVMGGTFDPVHHGHLIVARSAAEHLGLERVMLVPTGKPPHKAAPEASAHQRLEMLNLATAGQEMFEVCDLEVFRSGPSYTFDTVVTLREQLGPDVPLYWLVGLDMLADLPKWHRAKELVELVDFVSAARMPWQQRLAEISARLAIAFGVDVSQRIAQLVSPTPVIEISSSDIRLRVRQRQSISYLVPHMVETYIEDLGLYLKDR